MIVIENLEFYRERLRFLLHAYVVMPDHLHLLLTPGEISLSDIMRSFKSHTAKQIISTLGSGGPIWQSRFHDRAIRGETHFLSAIEYIHQNPVLAGLALQAKDHPYSSASAFAGTTLAGSLAVDGADGSRLGP